jgi:ACS family pantothenate transporter-like MFS transporter
MGFLHNVRVAVWGEPPPTRAESKLVRKVDIFILSFICLLYWVSNAVVNNLNHVLTEAYQVNYLDRANLNNAYVSGAREDLGFQGT